MKISRRQFNKISLASIINFQDLNYLENKEKYQEINQQETENIKLHIPTFLGDEKRKFYGRGSPKNLGIERKINLGSGKTRLSGEYRTWSGTGWTGQPMVTEDNGKEYLTIGAYDHSLRKIDLDSGEVIWRYLFDDVIKGSSTIYIDEKADEKNKIIILQGSRAGLNKNLSSEIVPSFRAISFRTGDEIWRMNLERTRSYSRDNDSSPLILEDEIFNAGENAIGYFLEKEKITQNLDVPLKKIQLYEENDSKKHGGNLVAESSPARFKDNIFIACGSGHIYGININNKEIFWDFEVGSDIDGTMPISEDGKLFCPIEKQYIQGNGGILKLNPKKNTEESVEWFLPTENKNFASWKGGIIGSVTLNDYYNEQKAPKIFATTAIDGYLYIGSQNEISNEIVKGPNLKNDYFKPKILAKEKLAPSIATPIFTDENKLVVPTYNGVYLFKLNFEESAESETTAKDKYGKPIKLSLEKIAHTMPGNSFESSPVVWKDKIYIGSRDGFLYTLG